MSTQRIIDRFVDIGFKEKDVSRSVRETHSYYEKVGLLYRYISRKGPVQSTGGMHPKVMIVSDRPEESERICGFSGFSEYSIFIMIILQRFGISIDDVFWTQAIKDPSAKLGMRTINQWHPHLFNEIIVTEPKAIIALGTTSISSLVREPIKIDKAMGKEFSFEMPDRKIPIFPIKHPRSILNDSHVKEDTKQTWQCLKSIGALI